MNKDDRLHAFIVAQTSRTRSQVRKISIHKSWLKIAAACFVALLLTAVYGVYSAMRRANELHIELENQRLRTDNEKQRDQLNELQHRIEALEDQSRRLAEATGVAPQDTAHTSEAQVAGGPSLPLNANAFQLTEQRATQIEQELHRFERAMREKELARIPSIWPLMGKLTDGFGARRNPFGGGGYEFHPGQDIAGEKGTPVIATADGIVAFADWQSGYGQLVVIDHQNGLFTRFGHLSQINVTAGQRIKRGAIVGLVGSTGRSTGPHLHYEVRVGDQAVNPLDYLPH